MPGIREKTQSSPFKTVLSAVKNYQQRKNSYCVWNYLLLMHLQK